MALCSAPAQSTALPQLYPPPFAGALPTLSRRSSSATPTFSPALHRHPCPRWHRAPQHYSGALPRASPWLDYALRRRFTLGYVGALCRCWGYSLCFVAFRGPSPALFYTLCRHLGTLRPLEFNTTCGRAARWGASWWGGPRCSLLQSNYCLV